MLTREEALLIWQRPRLLQQILQFNRDLRLELIESHFKIDREYAQKLLKTALCKSLPYDNQTAFVSSTASVASAATAASANAASSASSTSSASAATKSQYAKAYGVPFFPMLSFKERLYLIPDESFDLIIECLGAGCLTKALSTVLTLGPRTLVKASLDERAQRFMLNKGRFLLANKIIVASNDLKLLQNIFDTLNQIPREFFENHAATALSSKDQHDFELVVYGTKHGETAFTSQTNNPKPSQGEYNTLNTDAHHLATAAGAADSSANVAAAATAAGAADASSDATADVVDVGATGGVADANAETSPQAVSETGVSTTSASFLVWQESFVKAHEFLLQMIHSYGKRLLLSLYCELYGKDRELNARMRPLMYSRCQLALSEAALIGIQEENLIKIIGEILSDYEEDVWKDFFR